MGVAVVRRVQAVHTRRRGTEGRRGRGQCAHGLGRRAWRAWRAWHAWRAWGGTRGDVRGNVDLRQRRRNTECFQLFDAFWNVFSHLCVSSLIVDLKKKFSVETSFLHSISNGTPPGFFLFFFGFVCLNVSTAGL